MFTNIAQDKTETQDLSLEFADFMYKNTNGIVAHDLAHRIYKSEGEIEISEEEESLILNLAANMTPVFLDSLKSNIHFIS